MAILFDVDARGGVPIYVQLVDQVRRAVEAGVLAGGDRLPTVRDLAAELGVAPNTVVKAYGELQRDGVISSRPGVGTVISYDVEEKTREARVEALYGRLTTLVRDAATLGVTEDDLWERVDREFERIARGEG